uniref:peptidylprolyl isomerase n=2 Tax=Guillardia theta TaxID=55529 RepID=A0A7S4NGL0_GUITH|mmetsp:Transcript_21732/g.71885  ORF Transcript_21732/g.71885 Transcript_21732/m.71885 type:complete len:503 (+) Transcript_21732:356-1864(+)
MAVSLDGVWMCSVSSKDKVLNVFDVINFDMVNRIQLDFTPSRVEWISRAGANKMLIAIACADSGDIKVFDSKGSNKELKVVSLHKHPVCAMCFHPQLEAVISTDKKGIIEMWDPDTLQIPSGVKFRFKSDTDLYELAKTRSFAYSLDLSPDGDLVAAMCSDKQVRIWRCLTGKLFKKIDESLSALSSSQAEGGNMALDALDFGRRMAVEKEMESNKSNDDSCMPNAIFDQSGKLLLYGSLIGIKVVNLVENKVMRVLGKPESSERFLSLSLYQGRQEKVFQEELEIDPILCATSYGKSRFYLFSKREPATSGEGSGRDILNEKPQLEFAVNAAQAASKKLGRGAVIHTTMGDITIKLFPEECPKTVENFCTHAKNGYYNGVIFHRVIKSFMLQTGDPLGDGTGGTSIWGTEFEDEFHRSLRHDRPFTVSMANAGPNTNGSQFFITSVPTPWLDNKHTVFGRCVKGMDVVQAIENVRTNKEDKPWEDISIVSIRVLDQTPSAK